MASNTLSGAGVSPANTKAQLLHIGTGSAAVATIRLGDGTATCISFVSGGFKVTGTFEVTTNVIIGGTLTVTGVITGLGIPNFQRLTSDVVATDTTNVAITAFDFTPVNGAVYELELALIAQSAATGAGVRIVNTGGSGTLVLAAPGEVDSITATGGTYSPGSAPVANANFGILLKGIFVASSTAALTFAVKSEDTNDVTLKAGSIRKITRIS